MPIAENHITITKKLFTEGWNAVSDGRYRRTALISSAVFWVLWLCMFLYGRIIHAAPGNALVELVVVLALTFYLVVLLPRSQSSRAYRALKKQRSMTRTTRLYDTYLVIELGEERMEIPYEDILTSYRTKHLLVLYCSNKSGLLLALDGFTAGSADLVEATLREYRAAAGGES